MIIKVVIPLGLDLQKVLLDELSEARHLLDERKWYLTRLLFEIDTWCIWCGDLLSHSKDKGGHLSHLLLELVALKPQLLLFLKCTRSSVRSVSLFMSALLVFIYDVDVLALVLDASLVIVGHIEALRASVRVFLLKLLLIQLIINLKLDLRGHKEVIHSVLLVLIGVDGQGGVFDFHVYLLTLENRADEPALTLAQIQIGLFLEFKLISVAVLLISQNRRSMIS